MDSFQKSKPDSMISYKNTLSSLEKTYDSYIKLINASQNNPEKIKEAYDIISRNKSTGEETTAAWITSLGWLLEPIEAKVIQDALKELGDVEVVGSAGKLTDYKITMNGNNVGINLKMSKDNYNIKRSFKIQDILHDFINQYYYIYYNYSIFSNMYKRGQSNVD